MPHLAWARQKPRPCVVTDGRVGVQRKALARITGEKQRLSNHTALVCSTRHRFPYLDPLHHLQVELVRSWRVSDGDDWVQTGSHIFINGTAAGLRNIG